MDLPPSPFASVPLQQKIPPLLLPPSEVGEGERDEIALPRHFLLPTQKFRPVDSFLLLPFLRRLLG